MEEEDDEDGDHAEAVDVAAPVGRLALPLPRRRVRSQARAMVERAAERVKES